jgi:hypothetical protein
LEAHSFHPQLKAHVAADTVKAKVMFALVQATKAKRGSRGKELLFL